MPFRFGAVALNTTGDARLDLFGTIGSLRTAEKERITRLFSEAWKENPLFATKTVFYARDVRRGLGERKTFRTLLQYMAERHQEALKPNLVMEGIKKVFDPNLIMNPGKVLLYLIRRYLPEGESGDGVSQRYVP